MVLQTWWIIAGVITVLAVAVTVLIIAGHGPTIKRVFVAIWGNPIGRHVIVILLLILVFEGVKAYSIRSAKEKASQWLTDYNGSETTSVVGKIEASVPGFLPTATPTPSASPTVSPTPDPTPSPLSTPTPPAEPTNAAGQVAENQRAGAAATPTPPNRKQ